MSLTSKAKYELSWWLKNIEKLYNVIGHQSITATVYSDASLEGWGAVFYGPSTGGYWSLEEAAHHITYVELLAACFAITAYATSLLHQHVRIMIDNTAPVVLLNT